MDVPDEEDGNDDAEDADGDSDDDDAEGDNDDDSDDEDEDEDDEHSDEDVEIANGDDGMLLVYHAKLTLVSFLNLSAVRSEGRVSSTTASASRTKMCIYILSLSSHDSIHRSYSRHPSPFTSPFYRFNTLLIYSLDWLT